jgi:hypothetical protein
MLSLDIIRSFCGSSCDVHLDSGASFFGVISLHDDETLLVSSANHWQRETLMPVHVSVENIVALRPWKKTNIQ